ncbi:hypothetical protein [Bacillus toyonensis]|uniref:hypothetical protein n=1 Tax=Bacillus toyonensis TaxID=155322 RepID=UPI00211D7E59|nr:hypothetical protein [Bacillus toyonensis]
MFHKKDLESNYQNYVEICKGIGNRYESSKGYEISFLLLTVTYDGRKRSITDEDIMKAMVKVGYVTQVGDSMLGGFYLKTPKLTKLLADKLAERKSLVGMV